MSFSDLRGDWLVSFRFGAIRGSGIHPELKMRFVLKTKVWGQLSLEAS